MLKFPNSSSKTGFKTNLKTELLLKQGTKEMEKILVSRDFL